MFIACRACVPRLCRRAFLWQYDTGTAQTVHYCMRAERVACAGRPALSLTIYSSDYPHFFLYLRCKSADVRFSTCAEMIPFFCCSPVARSATNGVSTCTWLGWNGGPPA